MSRNVINILKPTALVAVVSLACFSSAHAVPISLNFELPSLPAAGDEAILDYYNGGTDQLGDAGPNYGISFSANGVANGQYPAAPGSNVNNEPGGGNELIFLSGSSAIMNVAGGFNTGLSAYYAEAASVSGSLTVWSGLNGTGTLLASLALPGIAGQPNGTEPYYNVWDAIGVSFSGTAESVDFSGTANLIGFSDLTLNSVTPVINAVPDSTGVNICVLAGLALAGAGFAFRKQGTATV